MSPFSVNIWNSGLRQVYDSCGKKNFTKSLENTILSHCDLRFLEVEVNRQETSFYIIIPDQGLMSNILRAFSKQRNSFPQNFVSPSFFTFAFRLYLPSTVLPSEWAGWHFSVFLPANVQSY